MFLTLGSCSIQLDDGNGRCVVSEQSVDVEGCYCLLDFLQGCQILQGFNMAKGFFTDHLVFCVISLCASMSTRKLSCRENRSTDPVNNSMTGIIDVIPVGNRLQLLVVKEGLKNVLKSVIMRLDRVGKFLFVLLVVSSR